MRAEGELKQLGIVIDRLVGRHPEVPRARVESLVWEVHAAFAASPVREFVPLLVERGANDRLRAEALRLALRTVS